MDTWETLRDKGVASLKVSWSSLHDDCHRRFALDLTVFPLSHQRAGFAQQPSDRETNAARPAVRVWMLTPPRLQNDDAEEAVQHLSDAISLSAANHELLFSRGTAYVKLEKWADAVADLEKVKCNRIMVESRGLVPSHAGRCV